MRCFSLSIVFFTVFSWYHVAEASLIKRGTATMMSFGDDQLQGSFDKRNRGTWYSGSDLKNAACYDRKGLPKFSAGINDMIGAMAMRKEEYCFKCMQITNNKNNHRIVVKIVDKCAACKVGEAIDLTPGAFKKLNPEGLDDGILDISWKVVECDSTIKLHFG